MKYYLLLVDQAREVIERSRQVLSGDAGDFLEVKKDGAHLKICFRPGAMSVLLMNLDRGR